MTDMISNKMPLIDKYEGLYGDVIGITSDAMRKNWNYNWTDNDTLAFGQYADNYLDYRDLNEDVNTGIMGRTGMGDPLPTNLGLVARAYAAIPIQHLASIQPLADEAGMVYYQTSIATDTKGDFNKGDVISNSYGAIKQNIHTYVGEVQVKSIGITGDVGAFAINTTLGNGALVRQGSVRVKIGSKVTGFDDGQGHILGIYIDSQKSTINYQNGNVELKFLNLASAGVKEADVVDITFELSSVESEKVPGIIWTLDRKIVTAEFDLLQMNYASTVEAMWKKKFGDDMSSRVTQNLVSAIASSQMYKAIARLREAAVQNEVKLQRTVSWKFNAPQGVSPFDYRRTFRSDVFSEVREAMYELTTTGDVTALITGAKGLMILEAAGMQTNRSGIPGPYLAGNYQGIPVYYCPGNKLLGQNEMLAVYRGQDWFMSPLVYGPYLPVTVVSGRSVKSVLNNAQGVYHAAAMEVLEPGFVIRINLDDTPHETPVQVTGADFTATTTGVGTDTVTTKVKKTTKGE